MPGQGVTSMFTFGRSVGAIDGCLAALCVPVEYVSPAKWKRFFGLSKDKGLSRRAAIERWPSLAEMLARVSDDGRAEAALIAEWGRRNAL